MARGMAPPLVLLGSGYTLTRLALAQAREGRTVIAATRDEARRSELERAGASLSRVYNRIRSRPQGRGRSLAPVRM